MKNVMKRAWEIYRTLTGDHSAKLSMALRQAWAEAKSADADGKAVIMARLNTIIANSSPIYSYSISAKDWAKGGNDRTYYAIYENGAPRHCRKVEFGYYDNVAGVYVAGKFDAMQDYNMSGSRF